MTNSPKQDVSTIRLSSKMGSWVGRFSFENMFEGSKSEGVYPVLLCADSVVFRIYIKDLEDISALDFYEGKIVKITGTADNLRGHWRIVTKLGSIALQEAGDTEAPEDNCKMHTEVLRSDSSCEGEE